MRSPLEAPLLACCRYSEHTVRFVVSSLEGQKGFRLPGRVEGSRANPDTFTELRIKQSSGLSSSNQQVLCS